jgi:hypothetical protein
LYAVPVVESKDGSDDCAEQHSQQDNKGAMELVIGFVHLQNPKAVAAQESTDTLGPTDSK